MQQKGKWRRLKSRSQFIFLLIFVVIIGVVTTTFLTQFNNSIFLSLFQTVISFGSFIFIFLSHRDPSTKWAWILIIFAVPIVGVSLFFLFGRNKKYIAQFQRKIDQSSRIDAKYEAFIPLQLGHTDHYQQRQYQFLQTIAPRPMYQNTQVDVQVGQAFFDELVDAVLTAKHHIHLEFYIVRFDSVTKPLFDALMKQAQSGVEVRLLVDAGGSFNTLGDETIRKLVEAGILFAFFGEPQSLVLDSTLNWRNHRKVAVIDGETGFIGGFNLGKEYVFGNEQTKNWRDTNLKLQGEAVRSLQTLFLGDWYFSTHEDFSLNAKDSYFPTETTVEATGIVQIISDGPDTQKKPIKNSLYKLITSASNRIWLTSPYLILPDDILQALKAAALSGVDVRISVPGNPDKWLIYRCSQSYFEELLQAGVKIYLLNDTFQHSKVWIFDDQFGACGTVNLDYRSLLINFEAMVIVSEQATITTLADVLERDFQASTKLELRSWHQRPLIRKLSEGVVRLFSPIF